MMDGFIKKFFVPKGMHDSSAALKASEIRAAVKKLKELNKCEICNTNEPKSILIDTETRLWRKLCNDCVKKEEERGLTIVEF